MILGVGIDVVDTFEFSQTLARAGDAYLRRVYTDGEIEYCKSQPHSDQSFAVRFAAKEAAMKALCIPGEEEAEWHDFEIACLPSGRPEMRLAGNAAERATAMGVLNILVSLSHSRLAAVAVVVVEAGPQSSGAVFPKGMIGGRKGRLFVFEGPDGVGKTTLAEWFLSQLQLSGCESTLLSFPGKEQGSLGQHVYELHHRASGFGIRSITAAGLQLLHVAAHVDAIETRIKPLLEDGQTVVLDRYWWSTFVYGLVGGVRIDALESMIKLERAVWKPVDPDGLFLILRKEPLRGEHPEWYRWRQEYLNLARTEATTQPIFLIDNDESLANAQERILESYAGQTND